MPPTLRFPRSRAWWIACTLPFALALAGAWLAQPRLGTLIGIPLGPWAGVALGHHDCTMGIALRGPSWAACALGIVGLLVCWRAGGLRARRLGAGCLGGWAWCWSALAWMSVVNTTS